MGTTNHYDLIVLGADLAGLVAAALAARRGKRVLVVPHGPVEGENRVGTRRYPLDPSPVIHLDAPIARRIYDELGLRAQYLRDVGPMGEAAHWDVDGRRFDIRHPTAEHLSEDVAERLAQPDLVRAALERLAEVASINAETLDPLLGSEESIGSDGRWSRRILARAAAGLPDAIDDLEPLPDDHLLRHATASVLPWLQHLSPTALGTAARRRIVARWLAGPRDRLGGYPQVRRQLLDAIRRKSGEVKSGLRVADLLLRRGRVTGVALLGRTERYGCEHMIVATDPRRLVGGSLEARALPAPLDAATVFAVPTAHRFVLNLDFDPAGLSPALRGPVVITPDDPPPSGVGTVYVRVHRSSRPAKTSPVARHISITAIVDAATPIHDLREQLLDSLHSRGVLPFVRRHALLIHSPHDGRVATRGDGSSLSESAPDSGNTLPMAPLYACREPPELGLAVVPIATSVKNLHSASRLSFPGLGFEGELLAGLAAAQRVSPDAARGGVFRR
jgi:hypothetical protein